MARYLSVPRWLATVRDVESLCTALTGPDTPGFQIVAQRALWWLRDERNPLAAGAALLRIADDLRGQAALQQRLRSTARVLVQYVGVRNPLREPGGVTPLRQVNADQSAPVAT